MSYFAENFAHMIRGALLMYYLTRCVSLYPHRRENPVLGFLFWLFAALTAIICVGLVSMIEGMWTNPYVVKLILALDMCFIPVLVAFMLKITMPRWITPTTVLLMLFPSVVFGITYLATDSQGVYMAMFIYTALFVAAGLVLILASVRYYNNYLRENYSDLHNRSVSWIARSVFYFVGWYVAWIFFSAWNNSWWMYSAYFAFMLVIWPFIYRNATRHMAIAGMPDLFIRSEEVPDELNVETNESSRSAAAKEKSNGEKPSDADIDLMNKIGNLMNEEHLYKTIDLSLDMLALRLGQTRHNVSGALNRSGKSFYTYINECRVREAIRILSDPAFDKLTIDGIAFESGFNDRTNFYRTFKKATGLSPASFRKTARKR